MPFPLPPGRTQFCDANGNPISGGSIFHYVPGTYTPKDTYQDLAGTILNTNPVFLDSAGEATIIGLGAYRQVANDALGNQLWDQVTAAVDPAALGLLQLTGGTMTGTLVTPSVQITDGDLITMTPTGDAITTLTSLDVQGTTSSTTTREFMATFGLLSNKRNGSAGGNASSVALYAGIDAQNGTGDVWAIRGVTLMDASSGTYNALGAEIDLINNVADYGVTLGAAGLTAPSAYALALTGTGAHLSTAAMLISGPGTPIWQRGIVIANNSVAQASFQDLSSATISHEIQGAHSYGWDSNSASFSGSAIRFGNNQRLTSRNVANNADINMVLLSGANLVVGDAAAPIVMQNTVTPSSDNTYSLGANGFRWAAVWAANGTIQTSDPSLKTDITPLSTLGVGAVSGLVDAIDPIHFRWADGGGGIPGKRTHWGWSAENIKSAFDAVAVDFGGYVLDAEGTRHLRPDQLLPVLWQEVKAMRARIAELEKRA